MALHEAVHGARVYAPTEYHALESFIINYLVENNQNVDKLLDNIAAVWGKDAASRATQLEELVANTVMALASDENAFTKAVETPKNKDLLVKVKEALKGIIDRVKEFFRSVDENGRAYGHNKQAQPWLDDVKALEQLADKFNKLVTAAKQNEAEYGSRESGARFSIKDDVDGNKFVDIQKTVPEGLSPKELIATLNQVIKDRFSTRITANKQTISINSRTSREWVNSKSAKTLRYVNLPAFEDKMNVIENADEILKAARDWIGEKSVHNNYSEFARGYIEYRVGENGYVADVIVGTKKSGAAELYDLTNIYEKDIAEAPYTDKDNSKSSRSSASATKNIIPQSAQKSNTSEENNLEVRKSKDDTIYDFKDAQNEIIQKSNPVNVDYLTWIRSAKDINTFEETLKNGEYDEGEDFDPSYTWDMAQKALKSGKITVYSSYPIQQRYLIYNAQSLRLIAGGFLLRRIILSLS